MEETKVKVMLLNGGFLLTGTVGSNEEIVATWHIDDKIRVLGWDLVAIIGLTGGTYGDLQEGYAACSVVLSKGDLAAPNVRLGDVGCSLYGLRFAGVFLTEIVVGDRYRKQVYMLPSGKGVDFEPDDNLYMWVTGETTLITTPGSALMMEGSILIYYVER